MSDRLRVAVVGLGIGSQHVRSYELLSESFELAAICDLDDKRLERTAKDAEALLRLRDFDALLARDDIDVIDICTPPHLHFDQCRAALESGHHVICEKPLVPSLAQLDALAEIERASGKRLMPIFQYRFGAGLEKLRHLVDSGLAGRAYLSTIETSWTRGDAYYAEAWRGKWESELGGVLTTHAIHAHDILCVIVGPIRSVFARTTTRVNPIETEDCASVSLEMADGSLASLSATLGSFPEISRLRFCFEGLTAESALSPYTPSLDPWTFTSADPERQTRIDAALADFDAGPEWYPGQFARFHEALSSGTEIPVTLADSRRSLELLTAMYHSAETGQAVELPITEDHPKYESWLPKAR